MVRGPVYSASSRSFLNLFPIARRSWDLYSLRRNSNSEYTVKYAEGSGKDPNQSIIFNICGSIREACAPHDVEQGGVLPPLTHGLVIQYLDNNPPPDGSMCTDTNTCDLENDPQCAAPTVAQVPCTSNCEIVAPYTGSAPIFALLDETNPQGGISLRYEGAPAYAADPFGSCPNDPRTGLPAQRSFTLNLFCNTAVADFTDMVRQPYHFLSLLLRPAHSLLLSLPSLPSGTHGDEPLQVPGERICRCGVPYGGRPVRQVPRNDV